MKSLTVSFAAIAGALVSAHAGATDWNDWPTKFKTDGGYELGVRGTYQFDAESFSNDDSRFGETQAMRREEFYGYVRKDGVFELAIGYDFAHLTRNWIDANLKIFTARAGTFRIGQFKTPVAWDESATGAGATVFLERALPDQAVYENRRLGVDWTYEQVPGWLFNLAYFGYEDLHGDNDGDTFAGRVVYNPVKTDDDVVHLGVAASREDREDDVARVRARPEANLTPVRLVDTGNLPFTDHIDRIGLEAGWKRGPWLVMSEYLAIDVARRDGRPDFSGDGFYAFGSYVLTGESHPYKSGAFNNIKPKHDYGAVELALRYSEVDLDDGVIRGGRQNDWTLGANWYLGTHLKLQGNYVRATSDRRSLSLDPNVFELRAQVYW